MVGRATGSEQRHHRVDDGALVDDFRHRQVVAVFRGQAAGLARGFAGQLVAQRGVRVDEGGARQVQAHHFHQQLVGVGGAIEGAGARRVVGSHFRGEQLLAGRLALGEQLAHGGLFLVGDAGGHRPGRDEHHRQMAEAQRADQQAGDDLVAHAQAQRGVEHVVREGDGGAHGDHVAAGQRQLHPRFTLGDAVAHGRHPAGELADRADLVQGFLDQRREAFQRLVRREHVVVGGNDGDVGLVHQAQRLLVAIAAGRDGVGEVAAGQRTPVRALGRRGFHHGEITLTGRRAAGLDALGDFEHAGVHGSILLQTIDCCFYNIIVDYRAFTFSLRENLIVFTTFMKKRRHP
ncbi:hypothetical protein D9M71_259730 [compost metagenome]